jgi:arachidonate 5-lipoxygenase
MKLLKFILFAGNTHLLMETIVVAANRHLSPSHPIFRLLAPHFLYLLAIDA